MEETSKKEKDFLRIGIQEAYLCSEYLLKYLDNDAERSQHLINMEGLVQNYCLIDHHVEFRPAIVSNMKQEQTAKLAQQENSNTPVSEEDYSKKLHEQVAVTVKSINVKNHTKFKDFVKRVTKLKREADGTGGEDDLMVTDELEVLIDPLSKKEFVDPVISLKCRHRFSRNSVMHHLRESNMCPYVGCKEKLHVEELEDDVITSNTLRRLQLLKR